MAALALRDAVLRLRRDGAFVAVPLWRVNEDPVGPHPVGSYEIWCPSEAFVNVFSYLCQHHGNLRYACIPLPDPKGLIVSSILVHPLTRDEVSPLSRIAPSQTFNPAFLLTEEVSLVSFIKRWWQTACHFFHITTGTMPTVMRGSEHPSHWTCQCCQFTVQFCHFSMPA